MYSIFVILILCISAALSDIAPGEAYLPWNSKTQSYYYARCPIKEKHFFACNYHRDKPSCICNYDDSVDVPHPNSDTCDHIVPVPDDPKIVAKITVAKDRNDLEMEFHLTETLSDFGVVPEEEILIVRKHCIEDLPEYRDFYVVLKANDTFKQIPHWWLHKTSPLRKQTSMNITHVEILNGNDLPSVGQTIYDSSASEYSYAKSEIIMISAVVTLVGVVLFITFYAVRKCQNREVKWTAVSTA